MRTEREIRERLESIYRDMGSLDSERWRNDAWEEAKIKARLETSRLLLEWALEPPTPEHCEHGIDDGEPLRCSDCGLLYSQFGMDTHLPNDQWLLINGSEGGVLCARCIPVRARRHPGATVAHMRIEDLPSSAVVDRPDDAVAIRAIALMLACQGAGQSGTIRGGTASEGLRSAFKFAEDSRRDADRE